MDRKVLLDIISGSGIYKFAELDQKDIVYDADFRKECEMNRCGKYGKCWMCPPDVGSIESLMEKTGSFPHAVIYQTVHELEDSLDVEGMNDGRREFVACSVRITGALNALKENGAVSPDEYMQLGVGACGICETCAKVEGQPCRRPELAIVPIDATGIFVSATAKNAGIKYINGANTVTYFGMVLYK